MRGKKKRKFNLRDGGRLSGKKKKKKQNITKTVFSFHALCDEI